MAVVEGNGIPWCINTLRNVLTLCCNSITCASTWVAANTN